MAARDADSAKDDPVKDAPETPEELSVNEGVDDLPTEDEVNRDDEDEEVETSPVAHDDSDGDQEEGETEENEEEVEEKESEPDEEEETEHPVMTSHPDEREFGRPMKQREDEEESAAHSVRREHTLDDLAEEETPLPSGVEPRRPKSFSMDEEEEAFQPRRSFNSNFPQSGVYTSRGGGGGKRGRLLLLLVIALLVIGGSVYLLKSRLNRGAGTTPSPSPTEEAVSTPTPTPTPSIDRSKYKVRVLNGTSTSGLAASVSGKLKDLGYQIDKTGNASNSAFTKTVINSKSGLAELVNALISDLAPTFNASAGGTLKDSDNADAEVILGAH